MTAKETNKSIKDFLQEANSVYDLPSTEEAVKWMHATCDYLLSQINLAKGNQGRKIHRLARHKWEDGDKIQYLLPQNKEKSKGTLKSTQKEYQVNQATQEGTAEVERRGKVSTGDTIKGQRKQINSPTAQLLHWIRQNWRLKNQM